MNIVRSYRALVLTLLLSLLLAACGGGGTGSTGGTSATSSTGGTSATSETGGATATSATGAATASAMAEPSASAMAEPSASAMAAPSASAMAAPSASAMAEASSVPAQISGKGAAAGEPIKIGSKNFTEEFIVAEMYALVLENAGFKVERKFNLGDTPVAQAGLLKGDLDLYPEYTSTGLLTVLKKQALTDPKEIYNTVKSGYEQQFKLTWLDASPFNDTEGLATTKTIADKYQLKTFTDLSTKAPQLILGGAPEFAEREDGIKGLQKTYGGFQFKEFKQLGTGTLRYDALKGGQIDIVEVFTTDARIGSDNLVVLQDDKTFYPVYNVAPVIRQDTLAANPKIADALNKLAPLLTDDVIRKLNAQVDIDSMEYQAVAKDFLTKQGLVKS